MVRIGYRGCFRGPVVRVRRMTDRRAAGMGIYSQCIRPGSLRIIWMSARFIRGDRGGLTMVHRGELRLVHTGLM